MTTGSIALPHSGSKDAPPEGPEAQIEQYRQDFATVLPSHIKPDMWVRVAQGLLRRDWKLAKAAKANVPSFLAALLDCARLGLEPGETYHLVPFGGEIVGIEDYKGLIELIYRAGAVESVKAEIVYEHDEYEYDPDTMSRPRHRPSARSTGQSNWFATREQRGDMVGAYCYCEMKGGGTSRVVQMAKWEIEEHKKASRTSGSADSMWQKWPRSAWLKTTVKEQSKWVPTSPEWITHKLRAERLDQQVTPELSPAARALPEPSRDVTFPDRDARHVIEGEVVQPSAAPTAAEPPRENVPLPDNFDRGNETRRMWAQLAKGGIDSKDRDRRLHVVTRMLTRAEPLGSFNDLTDTEIAQAVAFMARREADGDLTQTLDAMAPSGARAAPEAATEPEVAPRKGNARLSTNEIDMARNEVAEAADLAALGDVWTKYSTRYAIPTELKKVFTARKEELGAGADAAFGALWQRVLTGAPEDWTADKLDADFLRVTGKAPYKATAADVQRYLDAAAEGKS